ncbi:MAG: hypothetical protein AVDCRST_MAG64-3988, partial [uncultured Phycisphaerae bacterium]
MNQALVTDVVAEVMRRLGTRNGSSSAPPSSSSSSTTAAAAADFARGRVPAGEDAPANEGKRQETAARGGPKITVPVGQHGVYGTVDQCVAAATDAQKKLARLSLDDRDAIVKLIKSIAKQNAQQWGRIELDETKIGRLDHKVEKLQILE